jgi:hypothetical protein
MSKPVIPHAGPVRVDIRDTVLTNHNIGLFRQSGTVTEDYNLFYGNSLPLFGIISSGGHGMSGNPLFVNPTGDDYHIRWGSAARNMGVDVGVYTDIDRQTRPTGAGYDMGYDELVVRLYLPLIRR